MLSNGPGKVGLISTDDYRLGAQEQLLAFGRILDIPILHARNQDELKGCVDTLAGCQLVLIDPEGLKLNESSTESGSTAARFHYSEVGRVYPLIPAGSRASVVERTMQVLSDERMDGCIVTKIDECASLGVAYCNAIRHKLPLAYITKGQQVPRDLRVADRQDLQELAANLPKTNSALPLDDDMMAAAFSTIRTKFNA